MLLEFRTKNFKSFKEEMVFKMTPAQKIKGLEYSLIKKNAKNKEYKALPTAVIYGPNSSGKSNIISAIEVFRAIVLRGNIKDTENNSNLNVAIDRLSIIPNIESNEDDPVYFYIKFITENLLIEFSLKFKIGKFMRMDYDREILEEELKINDKLIYNRSDKINIKNIDSIKEYLIENFKEEIVESIYEGNVDNKELFFNVFFKTLYSKKIFDIIYNWFENNLEIIYRSDRVHSAPVLSQADASKKFYVDKIIDKVAKRFGTISDNIAYPISEKKDEIKPVSLIKSKNDNKGIVISSEVFESLGTVRLMDIFPMIYIAIKKGNILIVDELDISLHPMAIMNIIRIFQNDEINKKGAQLIFNTHNPIFLNKNLLRRDEIKFIEKKENSSIHYSLSDFGTTGEKGVRKEESYMKNYFINKYGAINDIDFSDIFEE
ncbi:MAG TPA: AAA family ATPase [Candidatus Scatovivens faecipullorum]|nr:AAA family ATPase [Candidatus Scatovivens faecipullorum]